MKLELQNISKTYPNGVKAIDGINLDISSGMFGLLGQNGAGKSSLMRTIATLQLPDTGSIKYDGLDIFSNKITFRKQLGYLPQDFGVYPNETAIGLLSYLALLKGISSKKERNIAVGKVLEYTNLTEVGNKKVSNFSGGMKQRFGIAQLLLNQPKIIIVDEPTAGLDPEERNRFLNVLRNIGSDNIVIFSTHLVNDVKQLCNDLAIIKKGRLVIQSSPLSAIQSIEGKIWETQMTEEELNNIEFVKLSERFDQDNQTTLRLYAEKRPNEKCCATLPTLEDFYFLKSNSI